MRRSIYFSSFLIALCACSAFKPLDEKLLSADDKVRVAALKKLPDLSEKKQTALVERLVNHLNDPDSRVVNRAVDALTAIGQPAVDGIRRKMKDPDVFVRLSAVSALGQIGPLAHSAVPDLIESLQDPHPLVREESAYSLGQMGQAAQAAGPALLASFKSSNKDQQRIIADALKKIGIRPPTIS